MEDTKAQLMVEIMKILELTQEQIKDINNDIQNAMTTSGGTTEDMIRACKIYDPTAFMAGAMVTTTVLDLVRGLQAQKMAEQNRLEGNLMDAM